jgi:hypothetical protein
MMNKRITEVKSDRFGKYAKKVEKAAKKAAKPAGKKKK